MWENITEYITKNYNESTKIVEVGVGRIFKPSSILKDKLPNTEIVLVDIHPANENVIMDDICTPTDKIYENSDLIYSIRPPEELQKSILKLGIKYKTDIIIKPLFTEEINYELQNRFKLVNYKKTAFYIYEEK